MASPASANRYDTIWTDVYGDMQSLGPVHRHMRRLLRKALHGLDYRTAVDVGCGAGDNVALLLEAGAPARVVGLDVSPTALDRARERHPGEYVLLDIEREVLDERFDLVFSSLLLEHLPDDSAALRNMCAMTGRWLLVSTIAGDFERYRRWDERVGHVRNYAAGELERKLLAAGFDVERTFRWGWPFYSPLARLLQNRMRPSADFGRGTRVLAGLTYGLYFLNSSRRGDLLIALARPRPERSATAAMESSSDRDGA